jgi:hypothetical protein
MDVEAHVDLWGFLGGEGLDYLGRKIGGCSPLTMSAMVQPPQLAVGDVGEIGGCAVAPRGCLIVVWGRPVVRLGFSNPTN